MENLKDLGSAMGFASKYNGKPALITKSGNISQGEDYLEMGINTFRFAFLTKKGIHYILNRVKDMDLHAAFTLEGRDNDELPEQTVLTARLKGIDLARLAQPTEDLPEAPA